MGAVSEDWRARLLASPTPFQAEGEGLALIEAVGDTFEQRSERLAAWAHTLRARWGLPGWRNETVLIRAEAEGPPLARIERGLLRPLGLRLESVQACVWSQRADGPWLWVARRAAHKPVDPGRLDALVAGGIADFDTPWDTLMRECAEEAGMPPALAGRAQPAGQLELEQPLVDEGLAVLHRERVWLHSLEVPDDFVPVNRDGEHEAIWAMRPEEVLASIQAGHWTADGGQATLDLIARQGWLVASR